MQRINQYQCDFCNKIHTNEADALKCEQSCKEKVQKRADEGRKKSIIQNKLVELDKMVGDFVRDYGYNPTMSDGSAYFKSAYERLSTKLTESENTISKKIGTLPEFLDELMDILTVKKQ